MSYYLILHEQIWQIVQTKTADIQSLILFFLIHHIHQTGPQLKEALMEKID